MALLKNLFDRKICSVCGGEIGLLGNRKLEDGNLCKTCASKLSPWFDGRRHSTVEDIREHLAYRENNRKAVAAFNPTRSFSGNYSILIDEGAGSFIVTRSSKWQDENPDVIPLSSVAEADWEAKSNRNELKQEVKTPDGKTERVSFEPRRYEYKYVFYLTLKMNPDFRWFDDIHIQLNSREISIDTYSIPVSGFGSGITTVLSSASEPDPRMNPDYCAMERLGNDICAAIMHGRAGYEPAFAPAEPAEAPAPEAAVEDERMTCEYCGSVFIPDGSGKCPVCGGPYWTTRT